MRLRIRVPPAGTSLPRLIRRLVSGTLALGLFALIAGGVRIHSFATERPLPPPVAPAPGVMESLIDTTPVLIRTTVLWQKVPMTVTTHALLHDRTIWRRMHFDDWDAVPQPLREEGMRAMVASHADVLSGPDRWRAMSVFDWDAVPQPVRAIAYLRMVWHWAEVERAGEEFGLRPRDLAPSIAAIVMAESWFEHRAVNENPWGNRDLGLAQCSDHCRQTLLEMAAAGEVPFAIEEEQYFDPWYATRVATVWFLRELRRTEGDVDRAIRAYHRGLANADDPKGEAYLAGVVDKRTRYVLNTGARSEAWRYLVDQVWQQTP